MNIIIDNREKSFFQEKLTSNNIIFATRLLDLGDILFELDGVPLLIIERKTINDLAASLSDGRYHEQKARLKNSEISVLYLIEGGYAELDKKYKGCILNTMLRDHIPVIIFFIILSNN